jgi:MoaA/NifB/PqqE/SkfB family radical SAM enzyme
VLAARKLETLDLTGGAPELHPRFRDLVTAARGLGVKVIDRCNLTILSEPGYEDLADFLAAQRVDVVASLPCYLEDNVDGQRGEGVYARSIAGLTRSDAGLQPDRRFPAAGSGGSGSRLQARTVRAARYRVQPVVHAD